MVFQQFVYLPPILVLEITEFLKGVNIKEISQELILVANIFVHVALEIRLENPLRFSLAEVIRSREFCCATVHWGARRNRGLDDLYETRQATSVEGFVVTSKR